MAELTVRRAAAADAARIHALMRALAEHEGLTSYLAATPYTLEQALSAQPPRAAFLLAEVDGRATGFVSWTRVYGVWRGADYLNLDDLFVVEAARGAGVGEALMRGFAAEAAVEGLSGRWEVRTDNYGARRFYARLGADQEEKVVVRWSAEAMRAVL
ncbi:MULTISPECIES: GNAT family N-acetyltransferase [Brevundimonas]|uniref:GNAT family N-acetyltransferase n=1 Tax=Brevundimonas sp. 357 TaxID=2555782 RepID=UPI000F780817|nr:MULTISPECIES: GNAT family N-acetyltransferase [Brevundimonas]RSB42808.1 N-acetyltransferase [Brevundimonas sp. 357]